jgi:catechol 2,3-dioxygenase-like lactoylglutathione lyase family enzyme
VAADVDAWRGAGFSVDLDGTAVVGAVRLRFRAPVGAVTGVVGWGLAAVETSPPSDVEGLPTFAASVPDTVPPDHHALGVVRVDHVVVLTPDLERTTATVEAGLGVALRRRREGPSGSGAHVQQAFFRLGEVILELVAGPPHEPVRFWGLAFETRSLDDAFALVGPEHLRAPKPAVQPGRRIASFRSGAGLGVPVALMDTPGDSRSGA